MANLIGKTLKQRYQVVESIGRGGMAGKRVTKNN